MSSPDDPGEPSESTTERKGPTAWDVALRLLGVRARSRSEMAQRLARRGFDADTIAEVMARLDAHKLLDDEEFAAEWVHSRHMYSGRGRVALRHELAAKGVDATIVARALDEIDPEDERATARGLVDRKLTPTVTEQLVRALDDNDRSVRDKHFRRLVGMLVRRGYPQAMAIDVVGGAIDEITTAD
ncbi:recombination regulator RecX [Gordonia otitidis]|uniref:regulatory protein RecX n=1 Tax=Gordonia otitidis TaxID=249058 RepID=UPI001D1406E8|nr:regulatory protein RecX [Gordonia otitidis]UEA59300.1 recombination regulator RecX [Gordonia otitidis]